MLDDFLNTSNQDITNTSGDQLQSPDFNMDQPQQQNIDPGKGSSFNIQNIADKAATESYAPEQLSFEDQITKAKNAKVSYATPESLDQFRGQSWFNTSTFNPSEYQHNLQKAADNETWGSSLGKAFNTFAFNFGNTFTGWFAEYPKMVDSLLGTDLSGLQNTTSKEENLLHNYYKQQQNMMDNMVFAQPGHEDDIFSKKFVSEFIGNAGFAMGTVGALGLEFAADAFITAATGGGGIGSFGVTAAEAAARLGSREATEIAAKQPGFFSKFMHGWNTAPKDLEQIGESYNVVKQIEQADAVSKISKMNSVVKPLFRDYANTLFSNIFDIKNSKNYGELIANFAKGTPLLGTGLRYVEKMAVASKNGAEVSHLLGMSLQGGRRLMQEFNMAASEAYFEGVSTYGDTLDKINKQYLDDNNGEIPDAKTYEGWKKLALDASSSNYNTNLGVLLISNHLEFGNLFNKYIPANRFVQEAVESTEENLIKITSKNGLEGVVKKHEWFGTLGSFNKISDEFGRKEAWIQLGKSALKNSLRFEAVEGFQENIQEITASGWRDYYSAKANGVKHTLNDSMMDGLDSQFTKQGWKTWLMGAFTGSLIKIPTRIINQSMQSFAEKVQQAPYKNIGVEDPITVAKNRFDNDIQMLNTYLKNAKVGNFGERVFNFTAQVDAATQHTEAAGKGLRYEFENSSDNALLSAASIANKLGTIDGFADAIKNTVAQMDADEFKKQFGIDLEDTKYSSPLEFGEKVATDVKKYAKAIDDFTRQYKTKFEDPKKYQPGTPEHATSAYIAYAENELIHMAALNSVKATMSTERGKKLISDLNQLTVLGNSTDLAIRVLTNPNMLLAEKGQLLSSVALLNDTLKAEGLDSKSKKDIGDEIKEKEKQLFLLDKWSSFFATRKELAEREGKESKDETYVFVGKTNNKKTKIKKFGQEDAVYNHTYDPKHSEVFFTFKRLLVSKNKEAGITTDIRDSELNEAFDKLQDYMKLDNDTKDYIHHVEILTNKEHFRAIVNHMKDGIFKFNLITYVDTALQSYKIHANILMADLINKNLASNITLKTYDDIMNKIEEVLINNPSYMKLVSLISNDDFGLKDQAEANTLKDDVIKLIKKQFEEITVNLTKDKVTGDITDSELADIIKEQTLDLVRRNSIADKLFKSKGDTKALKDKELEIYEIEKFKLEIDARIAELKEEAKPKNSVNQVIEKPKVVENVNDEDEEDEEEYNIPTNTNDFNVSVLDLLSNNNTGLDEDSKKDNINNTVEAETEDENDVSTALDLKTLENLYKTGQISKGEYDSFISFALIEDKLKQLNYKNLEQLTQVITSIQSQIQQYADKNKMTFEEYFKSSKSQKLINDIIKNIITEATTGKVIEEAPVIIEPEIIEKRNFPIATLENDVVSIDVISEMNSFFEGEDMFKETAQQPISDIEKNDFVIKIKRIGQYYAGNKQFINTTQTGKEFLEQINYDMYGEKIQPEHLLYFKDKFGGVLYDLVNRAYKELTGKTFEEYDAELASLENNVENSEKNVNFVNETDIQAKIDSVIEKFKDNKFEC